MQINRARLMLAALLAVFVFGAVAAAVAQAEEAPFWTVPKSEGSNETKRLAAGETRYITGKAYNKFTFESPTLGIAVSCEVLKMREGVLLGSNAGEPGTAEGILVLEKCTVTGNGGACKISEPISTTHVKSELVENVENGKQGKTLLGVLFPANGSRFTTVSFTGTCKTNAISVEGSFAGEARTDPDKPPELGEVVELPNRGKVAKSWLANFPATPIKEVWLIKAGVGMAVKVELKAATEPAVITGAALGTLAKKNSKGELEAVEENWSPLP